MRPPYIVTTKVDYDVMPDMGLVEGRTYEFELFNGRAVVSAPRLTSKERKSRIPHTHS